MIAEALQPAQQIQLSDAVLIATIGGVVTVVTSLIGAVFSLQARKQSQANHEIVKETQKAVNGRVENWQSDSAQMYRQEGMLEEQSAERGRQAVLANNKEKDKNP